MQITTLALCDAASVREGLLNVLGAGITFVARPSYPAPLLCDIAVIVNHSARDTALTLTLTLRESGKKDVLAEIVAEGPISMAPEAPKDATGAVPFAIDARGIAIPKPGSYILTAEIAGGAQNRGLSLSFHAVESPQQPQP